MNKAVAARSHGDIETRSEAELTATTTHNHGALADKHSSESNVRL